MHVDGLGFLDPFDHALERQVVVGFAHGIVDVKVDVAEFVYRIIPILHHVVILFLGTEDDLAPVLLLEVNQDGTDE